MIHLWSILIPILVVDVLNPVLLAFMVYATGAKRPVAISSALLLGHTAAYFVAGLVLAPGLEWLAKQSSTPKTVDFVIGLIVGLLLLAVALPSRKRSQSEPARAAGHLGAWKAAGLGAVVNFVGVPFALPYFGAIDQILKAGLSVAGSVLVLAVYNILYAVPFLVVPGLVAVMGERGRPLLEKINGMVTRASAFLMPVLLGLAGIALCLDAVMYFVTGRGLF